MKSARTRIAVNFIFIILVTVIILEVLIITIIRKNYYRNLEENLTSQIKLSSDLYNRYFSDISLHDNVLNNVDTFWKQVPAQVQIIDTKGRILMDSVGVLHGDNLKMPDVKNALKGELGKWIGKADYSNDLLIAVSYPLKSREEIVGAIRFVSSLREVEKAVERVASVILIIGVVVVIISGLISLFLANTIVGPLEEITAQAEKMAKGNFNIRCRKIYDDEIGKLADTLNYMAQEIMEKDRLKNEFISSVSHELRTPLTSIKGWAVTLKNTGHEDADLLADGLNIIEKEADRLTAMVEELLDFSRFVSGNITIKKEKVNIKELMCHIEKQLAPRAQRENISFKVYCLNDVNYIISDENRLKQVFINILDNSFKFTLSGGEITFSAESIYIPEIPEKRSGNTEGSGTGNAGSNAVRFIIKDTGCGIAPEDLPRVKDKFFKGKNSKSRNGIGLSICDEIIKLMNGTFEIKSEVNKGTEAIIILPGGGDESCHEKD